MLGIYLIVTVLSHLAPQSYWTLPQQGPSEIAVEFKKTNTLKAGTPVLFEGQVIGSVAGVQSDDELELANINSQLSSNITSRSIKLKISGKHRNLIKQGTIALLSSPLSVARNQSNKVVELIIPPGKQKEVLKEGDSVSGFSSYEEFWSNDSTNHKS